MGQLVHLGMIMMMRSKRLTNFAESFLLDKRLACGDIASEPNEENGRSLLYETPQQVPNLLDPMRNSKTDLGLVSSIS